MWENLGTEGDAIYSKQLEKKGSEWTGSKQLNELVGGDQQAGSLELWGGIGLERLK